MEYANPDAPQGHGEVLARPPYERWADILRENARSAAAWDFRVFGASAPQVRDQARRGALATAAAFSARLGVPVAQPQDTPELVTMTGHQPELYHPGVWAKDFLLQRLADETGAAAVDLVVDSDAFDAVEIVSPCMRPEPRRCRQYLAIGGTDVCYACAPVPSADDVELFCTAGADVLATLRAPAIGRHFGRFCDALRSAVPDAGNLAELVTFARRRYEAAAGTNYLELPVTGEAGTGAFATFVADIATRAEEFSTVHNEELAAYRTRNRLRGSARPFPDLRVENGLVELPFWHIADGRRESVWARPGAVVELLADGSVVGEVRSGAELPVLPLAPKAITLTMFNRMFVADLFIHGVGGARYDLVTDAVIRRLYGVEPAPFVVASMTMYLPLGVHVVTEGEVEVAEQRLNRLTHNPDQLLDEWRPRDAVEREHGAALAAEKSELTGAISVPGANKKALGARIRAVNEELRELLQPLAEELAGELDSLRAQRETADIMTDRTYPFCFWSPEEVADKLA